MSLERLYRPDVRVRAAAAAARDFVDGGRRSRDLAAAQAHARAELAVPAGDLRLLRGHTVDIVPYETSVASAYGLRWRPEPLLQWYTAFDAHLDHLNAAALVRHGAERILRQRTPTLDSKVTEFEAPMTYLALVCHYRELAADGTWEVLARTRNRCGRPRRIATIRGRANDPVAIPRAGRHEIVYAQIRLPRSLSNRLASTLFRPVELPRIRLGGDFRFVPATAAGPLVLRMPGSAGLSPLFGGFVAYEWFELRNVPSPFWVDFAALPIRGSGAISIPPASARGRLAGSEVVVSGRRYRIETGGFEGWVDFARAAGRAGVLAGWAIDPRARRPAPLVAAFVGDRLAALVRPSQARPDVAQGLDIPTVATSGYSLAIERPPAAAHVRVFALGHGLATELNYPSGYAWR
jgi:hypothetical protein